MTDAPLTAVEIQQIVELVWKEVFDLDVEMASPFDVVRPAADLSVCVHIAGAWNGAVLFMPGPRFTLRATASLFNMAEHDVTQSDIQDGMAELGNMLAGNLKALLPGPSALSLPTIICGQQYDVFVRRTRPVANLAFHCWQEQLSVAVLEEVSPKPRACAVGPEA